MATFIPHQGSEIPQTAWHGQKKSTNELMNKPKQTHSHRKQTYGYQRGRRGKGRDKLGGWDS